MSMKVQGVKVLKSSLSTLFPGEFCSCCVMHIFIGCFFVLVKS